MEFNEKLQQLRKQKGITQEELAVAIYVSRTAISKWESGRGYPSIDSLKALSDDDLIDENKPLIKQIDIPKLKTYNDIIGIL